MLNDRSSVLVYIGRGYQRISPILQWLEMPFYSAISQAPTPRIIVLVSPPRSGSTLTYQVMLHSFESLYLSNLWNLFYATPLLGGLISSRLCSKHQSNFRSVHGFIPGLCGPAEGLKFWKYWFGQDLTDQRELPKPNRAKRLVQTLGFLSAKLSSPFVAGYLGHAFCMNTLRESFPDVIFVYLRRDPLSNAYSMLEIRGENWTSLRPRECIDIDDEGLDLHSQVARQIYFVHRRIQEQVSIEDTFFLTYEELCATPWRFIKELVQFAEQRGIKLRCRDEAKLPQTFKARIVDPNLNEDSLKLFLALKKLETEYGPLEWPC